jgi:chloramphenicol-sensitive protein RarD
MLQYIAPTLLFLFGALVFGEPTNAGRLIGFAAIWIALLFYSLDALKVGRAASSR